jgi:hypothetical protein
MDDQVNINDPDFERILNLQPGDIERPKPLPTGMYLCSVKNHYEPVRSGVKGTPGIKFILTIVGVLGDVDEEELRKFGGYQGKTIQYTFWLPVPEPGAEQGKMDWRLQKFLDDCGVEPGEMRDRLRDCINVQVGAVIGHRADDRDKSVLYADVTRTFAPADYEADQRLPLDKPPSRPRR